MDQQRTALPHRSRMYASQSFKWWCSCSFTNDGHREWRDVCATEMGDVGEGKEGVGIPNFSFCIEQNSCIEFTTNSGKQNLTRRSNISRHTSRYCHELWLWNLGGTWPWEGHMTKPGLTRHVIRCLSLCLTSHVIRNENMTWCTLTSADAISVTSTIDTRTRQTTESSEIGSALTPMRVNATQSYSRRQCTLMGISNTQRGSWVRESCCHKRVKQEGGGVVSKKREAS